MGFISQYQLAVSTLFKCQNQIFLDNLVRLLTASPEDILDDNHKQLRSGKGNAKYQESIETCA